MDSPTKTPPIPNRPNPKPRNSEAGDPLRRSFVGNPFPANTKVNISSEFSRRNSFGGDKENETKPVLTPKGSKNFMSPTISAVSKINPSPRKRVLSDKNEMSQSFSDVKGLTLDEKKGHHRAKSCVSFSDVIHTICIDEEKKFEESHDLTVTDFDEKEVYEKKEITYADPRFRISPRPSVPYTSPEFAACEVDPLLPPYDPKKNYLSPRPQFLHYKPNPRIEKRFLECKQLDELFISDCSSSDTELSLEESKNCEEHEKDGAEAVVEKETEDVEQLEEESDEEIVCESIEETSQAPKQSGFSKFKLLGWFLALAVAYLLVSASISLPTESPFYEFHIPKAITEFSKANNLEQLNEKLWSLTELSLVYVDKLFSYLGGGGEEYGPLQFHNLTYSLEDDTIFQSTRAEINEESLQAKSRVENNLEDVYGGDSSANEFEEGSGAEENSEVVCDAKTNDFDEHAEMKPSKDIESNDGEGNLKALFEDGVDINIEELRESEMSPAEKDDARRSEYEEKIETRSTKKKLQEAASEATYIDQHDVESAAINMHQQKESEIADAESGTDKGFGEMAAEASDDPHLKVMSSNKADNDLAKADAESESEEACGEIAAETIDDLPIKVRSSNKADNDSIKATIILSSTVLVLLTAVALLFAKKAKPLAASAAPELAPQTTKGLMKDLAASAAPEPAPQTTKGLMKELGASAAPEPAHQTTKGLMNEKLSSLNFEEEVDDRVSNSFHKKGSFHKEPQSGGGKKSTSTSSKLKRESLACSASEYSVGSFSYGSFTTYEKIPIKSGDREEEMITPVRRSSRIRNNQPSGL